MDSWKENKENNIRYKRSKYKGHNHKNNYNNHYHIRKHYKDYKSYKFPYNQQSNRNNNNINNENYTNNYIEREIELNSKGEKEGNSEFKKSECVEESIPEHSADINSKKNDFNSQDNTEETASFSGKLNLMKSQSEELSHKEMFDFHEVGIKLFPGVFLYNKKQSNENKILGNVSTVNGFGEENKKVSEVNIDNCRNKYNLECDNYLCKTNINNCKTGQKNGLALALDYYSSFLEDKIIK